MKMTDELLSAFLDAALPEQDMEWVRQQLLQNEQLTERLADLAMVDTLVQQHYAQIDHQPLPDSVLQLLDEVPGQQSADIIAFPRWRNVQQHLQRHAAAVACIALFAGYGLSQMSMAPQQTTAALSPAVLQLLDSAPSGSVYAVAAEQQLTPRLSFISQQGDFCRQFALQSTSAQAEHIACRIQGQWSIKATLATERSIDAGQYQTAAGGSALDGILDTLMAGPALTVTAEQQYLTEPNN
jgi:hypothetical protein